MTLEAAKVISSAAEAEAEKNGWAVAMAVTDDGGELIHFIRKDTTTNAAAGVAQKKPSMQQFTGEIPHFMRNYWQTI